MLSSTSVIPGTRKRKIVDLPPEMTRSIFKYLSVNERKAARLVCKTWFGICDMPSLSDDEVISCRGCNQLSDTYDFLNRSQRRILNLKFNRIRFVDAASFWQINGSRIRSITFNNCHVDDNFMEKIIYSCDNLFHLAIIYTSDCTDNPFFPDLAEIAQRGIVRESLESLEIHYESIYGEERMIHIFPIFPKLKKLKMYFLTPYAPVLSVINDYLLASNGRIEKLELHFKDWGLLTTEYDDYIRILTNMKRLKELSVYCTSKTQQENVEKFIHSQPLKSLEYWKRSNRTSLELFMQQLNSSLKHLKLTISKDLVVTKCLYEKLMSSNLESCHLDVDGNICVKDFHTFSSYLSAEQRPAVLPSLTISIRNNDTEKNTQTFLQCFPNLHHLNVYLMSPNTLRSLLKYQKKLRSLIVKYSRFGCKHEKYDFSHLSDIERVELDSSLTHVFLRSLSPEAVFTKLKYLKIEVFGHPRMEDTQLLPGSDLLKLADVAPNLEALFLRETENRLISFISMGTELCAKLSQLKFLRWEESEKDPFCEDEYYRKIFSICPSLQVLRHRQVRQITKYFLTLTGDVTCLEDDRDLYTFAKPKIGGLTVDWLIF